METKVITIIPPSGERIEIARKFIDIYSDTNETIIYGSDDDSGRLPIIATFPKSYGVIREGNLHKRMYEIESMSNWYKKMYENEEVATKLLREELERKEKTLKFAGESINRQIDEIEGLKIEINNLKSRNLWQRISNR